jgi:hypothetical protein
MAVSFVALLVSLGGTGYAATQLPKGSVGTKQIKTNGVRAAEVKTGAIRSAEIRDGSIGPSDLAAGVVGASAGAPGAPCPAGAPAILSTSSRGRTRSSSTCSRPTSCRPVII